MELKFCYPGVGYSVESILEFTKEGQTGFWSEPVFSFFPQIDREGFLSGTTEDRRRYLTGFFAEYAAQMKEELAEKIEAYNRQWQENRASVIAALEEAFDTDLTDELSDLCARVTFNPISPPLSGRPCLRCILPKRFQGRSGEFSPRNHTFCLVSCLAAPFS